MMRSRLLRILMPVWVLAVYCAPASAEPKQLTGEQITPLLFEGTFYGKNSVQTFTPDGRTLYDDSGRVTYGAWEIRGNQYCSVWPPATHWACYDVLLDQNTSGKKIIIWVDTSGQRTINELR